MTERGFCGIGVWHPKTPINVGTLWRTAHAFDVAWLFTVGRRYTQQSSDTTKAWRHVPLVHYADLDDVIAHLPLSTQLVGVELAKTATSIRTFPHPERACYLLGAEDYGLTPTILERCHHVVQLPGRYCLNVAIAGSLVLYDRWRQQP